MIDKQTESCIEMAVETEKNAAIRTMENFTAIMKVGQFYVRSYRK